MLKNHSKSPEILQRFPSEKEICQQFNEKFDSALKDAQAQILDYPTLNIKPIFTDYFNNTGIFNRPERNMNFLTHSA